MIRVFTERISEHTLIQSYVSVIASSALKFQFLFGILKQCELSYPQAINVTMQTFLLKHHTELKAE